MPLLPSSENQPKSDSIAYLLLGSNLGDRIMYLQEAAGILSQRAGTILNRSSIYETEAWGVEGQAPYLNQALGLKTSLDAVSLLRVNQQIEQELGRQRKERWEARVIDIDILFFDQQVIEAELLQIPHPRLHLRRFSLIPLAELAPGLLHPALKLSVKELLDQCPDTLPVQLYKPC